MVTAQSACTIRNSDKPGESSGQRSTDRSGAQVLLIEDNDGDATLVRSLLDDCPEQPFTIRHSTSLEDGIRCLTNDDFQIVLTDLTLPDSTGDGTVDRIRQDAPDLPIVVLTGLDDEDFAVRAMETNRVDDFLVKGHVDGPQILRAMRYAISRRQCANQISHRAHFDPLTGLANRTLFDDRLEQAIARSTRNGDFVALLFADLDKFKPVNDTLGHHFGDELLRKVGRQLMSAVRDCDTIARMGGDEFAVILEGIHSLDGAMQVAEKLIDKIDKPFAMGHHILHTTASIGIAIFPDHGKDAQSLLRSADAAMYEAKRSGGNGFHVFGEDLSHQTYLQAEGKFELKEAMNKCQFQLHYQPILNAENGAILGIEALLRWRHPKRGLLRPDTFLRTAETHGMSVELDTWVIAEACRQAMAWRSDGIETGNLCVNLGSSQLVSPQLRRSVESALAESRLPPEALTLEISEHVNAADLKASAPTLKHLRDIGVRISLDDFGVDESRFEMLRYVSADSIKIDRSYVNGLPSNKVDAAITYSLISLAHHMDIPVVAEGVETLEQLTILRDHDADAIQGHLFCPPLSAQSLPKWMTKQATEQFGTSLRSNH